MKDLTPVGTVGLGLMGRSITACILAAGHPVIALESDYEKRKGAYESLTKLLDQLYSEQLTQEHPEAIMERLKITDDINDLNGAEIVIEAITENIAAKKELFCNLEKVLSQDAIIGSNTSAIPVSFLQEGLSRPERLLGIHWAEPAHITRFMEIICGNKTDIMFAEKIYNLAANWGKEPSLIK